MQQNYWKKTALTRLFDIFNVVLMLMFTVVVIYPFWNQLCISFSDLSKNSVNRVTLLPLDFTTDSYAMILADTRIARVTLISILRVVLGTFGTLFCTGLLAYITNIHWFSGRKFMRRAMLFTMYFGGGLIPTYLAFIRLGLYNNFLVYIIPALFSAYYMLIISSYISGLPDALFEAARIDGASEMKIYLKIILPVCIPVFAAIGVYCAVDQWNAWFDTTLYVPNGKWDTLQIYLRRILLKVEALSMIEDASYAQDKFRTLKPDSVRAATTMIVTLPIICVYPFLQRYFLSGITIGAVKE